MRPPPSNLSEPRPFLRDFVRALTDHRTYDVRRNPSLWLGFIVAIPIPILMFALKAPLGLSIASLFAPPFWSAVLGAAGRVGLRAQERADRAVDVAVEIQEHLDVTEEALGEEVLLREELQQEQEDILSELQLAEAVHRTLQPEQLSRDNVEVSARCIPSRFIGGDYVHVNVVEGRWLYLCVFDVSGHGVSASLVVARMHGLVRRLTLTKQSPEACLNRMNGAAVRILKHTYFFMTGVVARLDLRTGSLEYATAGHPAQFLLRADGTIDSLRTRNRLMGVDDDIFDRDEPAKQTMMEAGDTLILFTDGLFEVLKNGKGALLGESGLRKRVKSIGPLAPPLLLGEVLQDLTEYQGRSKFDDDVSLLVAQYRGPSHLEPT